VRRVASSSGDARLDSDPLRRASDHIGNHLSAATGDLKPRSGGDLVPTPKQVGLDPQMRPARQPPPIRHKMNHDAIAMARFFSGLLTLFSVFLFATLIGGLDWPFGCTRKSIATVMNITIWLFGAMRTRICCTAQCGIFCLFFQTNSGYKVASFPLGDD
jgi:hypothetical protein